MMPSQAEDQPSKELQEQVNKYLSFEKVPKHRQFIERLLEQNDTKQLEKLVGGRLSFGTAGLRGSMGPGFSQMNELVVIQTSQGLASYLVSSDQVSDARQRGVMVGFDARHNSRKFAHLAALAFLQKGLPVYFCDHIVATPIVAFGVRQLNCVAGVMVTASHNPANDNGYKVYASNGAQILSPVDRHIQESILRPDNQQPWPLAWQTDLIESKGAGSQGSPDEATTKGDPFGGLFRQVFGELSKSYFAYIRRELVALRKAQNKRSGLNITHTSLHGVGHQFATRALEMAGFVDVFPVEAQKKPDPEFSTVRFPNPEEAGALDLAFETAKHANSTLVLANDPDADRLGAALLEPKTGARRVLSGNEIGQLLGWWAWECHMNGGLLESSSLEQLADSDEPTALEVASTTASFARAPPDQCYMISTAVSSKFLASMAKKEGFQFVETLTGFKYMGNLAHELQVEHNKKVLFAFEEAIGYMVGSQILDKDGIGAAVQLAQCAAYVRLLHSRSLEQQLDWLYSEYGFHYSLNSYFICTSQLKIRQIFLAIQSNYPTNFSCPTGNFRVVRVRDLNTGYDSGEPNKRATLPTSSSSFMVSFFVDDDITLTIRTSGTEPKIKYYSEIVSSLKGEQARERARNRLADLVAAALEVCLSPAANELEAAA